MSFFSRTIHACFNLLSEALASSLQIYQLQDVWLQPFLCVPFQGAKPPDKITCHLMLFLLRVLSWHGVTLYDS